MTTVTGWESRPSAFATTVPKWRLCDRMRRSLDEVGVSVGSMAQTLEVNRKTVGNWLNGHTNPPVSALRVWAIVTGVDYDWLRGDEPLVRRQGLEPRTRWLRAAQRRPRHAIACDYSTLGQVAA